MRERRADVTIRGTSMYNVSPARRPWPEYELHVMATSHPWTWSDWTLASPELRTQRIAEAAAQVGGTVVLGLAGPCVDVRGCKMLLVPGGTVELGWDGSPVKLTPVQRSDWASQAQSRVSFDEFLRAFLSPQRVVTLPSMLLEIAPRAVEEVGMDDAVEDLEDALHAAIAADGFRLPTHDEWENAARAGTRTLFRWGDDWPDGVPYRDLTSFDAHKRPNPLGLELLANPYDVEIVAERDGVHGGDGGVAVCGDRPHPEPWYSFALAFRHPRSLWHDLVPEMFERAFVRRALVLNGGG
jgi:hypothetical protein